MGKQKKPSLFRRWRENENAIRRLRNARVLLGGLLLLVKVRKGDGGTCMDWLKSLWAEVMDSNI